MKIPFNIPNISKEDIELVRKALISRKIQGNGKYTKKAESIVEKTLGNKRVFLTSSCTHALEMAAILTNLGPHDEVIIPSYTFVTTALSFHLHGAKVRFADIKLDDFNIDPQSVQNIINTNTKAIVPMHYGGVACEMDEISKISEKNGLTLIEDNAHGYLGKYDDRYLGTFGAMSTLSFHETKNLTSGEGGALCINDERLIERAELIREKGTNRSKFFRKEVAKYNWVDIGSNYMMSEINAALLYSQLNRTEAIQKKREIIWNSYASDLKGWAESNQIATPGSQKRKVSSYHIFHLLFQKKKQAADFIEFLQNNSIETSHHYQPLHSSPFATKNMEYEHCPNADHVSSRLVRLPIFFDLNGTDLRRIIETILTFNL